MLEKPGFVRVCFHLPLLLVEELERRASKEDRTRASYIRRLIALGLNAEEKGKDK